MRSTSGSSTTWSAAATLARAARKARRERRDTEQRPLPAPQWPNDGIELHRSQQRILESTSRFIVACAGARGGKTVVGARKFASSIHRDHALAIAKGRRFRPTGDGVDEPLLRYWVGAPTYALTAVAQQELTKLFAASRWQPRWEGLSSGIYHRCWLGDSGILIEFKSGDNPSSLVSVPTHGQWWDEGAKLKPAVWHGNARQRLTDTMGWALFTSTPMGPGFYLDLFQLGAGNDSRWYDPTKRDDEWAAEHWTTADNPHELVRLDVERARKTLPKRYFDREYLASFDAYQGQVFEEFDASLICDRVARWHRVFGGVDFGHAAPGCVLAIGYDGHRYHVLDEAYHDRLTTDAWTQRAHKLCSTYGVTELYPDPAGAQPARDWSQAGLPIVATFRPRLAGRINDVSGGIKTIASLFAQKRLTISPRCVNLIRELRAYRYLEDSSGRSTDVVVKQDDHAPDALRYGIHADHLVHQTLMAA